ncbi:MAG: hypothetical protein Q9228_003861 [Teloschistes exilis]
MELPTLSRTPTSLNRHRFQIGPVIQAAESPDNPHNYDPKKKRIKLLLDPEQETPLYIPETNTSAELEKLGKPPTEVVTDYIASIYKHAFSRMESKAAKFAGIHPVALIKEPEAAAMYTLHMHDAWSAIVK